MERFKVTRERRVIFGKERDKRVGESGLWRYLVKVPRASGQTQTRQGDRHLGMSSCPQGSLNKVVESGGKGFGEAEEVEQMPLLTLRMCVFLCASVLLQPYAFL